MVTPEGTHVSNVIKAFAQLMRYPNTKGQNLTDADTKGQTLTDAEAAKNRFVHKILCLNTGGTSMAITTEKDNGEGNPCEGAIRAGGLNVRAEGGSGGCFRRGQNLVFHSFSASSNIRNNTYGLITVNAAIPINQSPAPACS
jgi:hypothetical protein